MKSPFLKIMPTAVPLWMGSALGLICLPTLAHSWGVTEIRDGEHDWAKAPWSAGIPGPEDTVYITGEARITLKGEEPEAAYGIRMGDASGNISTFQIQGAALQTRYVVVGDAANAKANFVQAGGSLDVEDTEALDFEIGNPANRPTEPSYSIATFAAGTSKLGDFRVNLREQRKSRVAFFGVLYDVSAKSLQFDTAGQGGWQEAELQFVLSDAGIAPVRIEGTADLGPGDRVRLILDGSRYSGGPGSYSLIEAGELNGEASEIQLQGFKHKAEVKREANRLVLILK
jgi:hypothetical protein